MGEEYNLSIQCLSMKHGDLIWGLMQKTGPSNTIRFVVLQNVMEMVYDIQLDHLNLLYNAVLNFISIIGVRN